MDDTELAKNSQAIAQVVRQWENDRPFHSAELQDIVEVKSSQTGDGNMFVSLA